MRPRCGQFVWIVLLAATFFSSEPVSGQIWKQFVPKSRGAAPADASSANDAANPHRPRFASDAGLQTDPNGDGYSLTQDSGPWLIVAASFSGTGGEKQARDLASELRDKFHLHAYVHEMDFKFKDDSDNTGKYGATNRRRLRRGDEVREIAVLVGDFASISGPDAQQMLAYVKSLEPAALNVDPNQTAQTLAEVRRTEEAALEKSG